MKLSKNTLAYTRLIHVYVSMALLTLLFFFSVTGITLNHPAWFSEHEAEIVEYEGEVILPETVTPRINKAEEALFVGLISEKLRQVSQSIDFDNADVEIMDGEIYWGIKSAGENTSITLELDSGFFLYARTNYGLWAKLNDLHKGRNTSDFWRWILDLSSLLFIVFAISGFMLAMPQRRFRRTVLVSIVTTIAVLISAVSLA